MRRPILLLLAVAMTTALLARSAAPVAYACSGGFDLTATDLVVGGTITGWEEIPDALEWRGGVDAPSDPDFYGPYTAIRLQMAVDAVYKGSAGRRLEMVSGNTVIARGQGDTTEYQWVGSSGACGAFDYDPTGLYWVLGLYEDEYGRLFPSLFSVLYSGDSPPTSFDSYGLAQIQSLLPGSPPSEDDEQVASSADDDNDSIVPMVGVGIVILLVTLTLGAAFAWRRTARP